MESTEDQRREEASEATQGPGNVSVDEPTDPALSGSDSDDFADASEEADEKSDDQT